MSEIFFTSDNHFGHRNILTLGTGRPFADLDEMQEALIACHNATVKPTDTVYFLGDMFWRTMDPVNASVILTRLQGKKHYIWGNHEELFEKHPILLEKFETVSQYKHINQPGPPKGLPGIFLCHYAMRTWYKSHQGYWHLYGHSHGGLSNTNPDDTGYLSMDIGVDTHNYYPWSLDEIKPIMEAKANEQMLSRLTKEMAKSLSKVFSKTVDEIIAEDKVNNVLAKQYGQFGPYDVSQYFNGLHYEEVAVDDPIEG
jgi:calcineurin-like phosphoesterase family protein